MAMIQKHWKFRQETSASVWEVNNIPDGADGAVISHIITDEGVVLQPDQQLVAPYGLQLSFGVQAYAGVAYGTYFTNEDSQVIESHGGTIYVNQYNHPKE